MRYSASLAEEVAGVLAATVPLGMPSGKVGHHPGWKPLQGSAATMSQARLHARAGSPDPSEGTCKSPSFFHRRDRNDLRAPEGISGPALRKYSYIIAAHTRLVRGRRVPSAFSTTPLARSHYVASCPLQSH